VTTGPFRRVCLCGRITEPGQSRCSLHPKPPVSRHRRYRNLRERLIEASGGRCYLCGKAFTADDPPVIDHVTPRAHGGTDDESNLAAAHRSCNGRKGATLPSWLEDDYRGEGVPRENRNARGHPASFSRVTRGLSRTVFFSDDICDRNFFSRTVSGVSAAFPCVTRCPSPRGGSVVTGDRLLRAARRVRLVSSVTTAEAVS
jgi:5-methylcytosine-specific restriction protein A